MRVCFFPANFDGAGCYRTLFLRKHLPFQTFTPHYVQRPGTPFLDLDVSRGVPEADVYVFQLPYLSPLFRAWASQLRGMGRKVVLEMDDFVQGMPKWHSAYRNRAPWTSFTNRFAKEADAVTASTPFLQKFYSRLNSRTFLVPNYLEREMWDGAPLAYETERRKVRVGWLGHAPMREGDVRVMAGFLKPFLDRNPQVEFVAAGDPMLLSDLGVDGVALPRLPFQRPDGLGMPVYHLPSITAVMDIGLVPLEMCDFNEAKSHLKGMEYAACGIPCVASPSESYLGWVDDGVNGFLASTPDEWTERLDELVNDDEFRRELGRNARAKAEENWLEDHIGEWAEVFDAVGQRTRQAA